MLTIFGQVAYKGLSYTMENITRQPYLAFEIAFSNDYSMLVYIKSNVSEWVKFGFYIGFL